MAFIRLQSPRGGKELSVLEAFTHKIKNLIVEVARKPFVKEDKFVMKIGYADRDIRKGEWLFVTQSEARRLIKAAEAFVDHEYITRSLSLETTVKMAQKGITLDQLARTIIDNTRLSTREALTTK